MAKKSLIQCLFAPKRRIAFDRGASVIARFKVFGWIMTFVLIFALFNVPLAAASLEDEVPESESLPSFNDIQNTGKGDFYYEHILRLSIQGIIVGDVIDGRQIGRFRPHDILLRSEFSKLVAFMRLSEKWGVAENWETLSLQSKIVRVFEHTRNYLNCEGETCNKIGGDPFPDVAESPTNCIDKEEAESDSVSLDYCEPWYGRHVYFGVDQGYFRGYNNGYFGPADNIIRLHAIKTLIIDNGHIPPEQDHRFQELEAKAIQNNSLAPKCIGDAKSYILDLNGGNTEDAKKLYSYAALADRLDIFGNHCQIFTNAGANAPEQRAIFLQGSLTRQEAARYFSFSSLYEPTKPNATQELTLNTAEENENTAASDKSYQEPEYEPTDIWQILEEMKINEEKYEQLLGWMGEKALEDILVTMEEKEREHEKEITEPKETIIEEPFEQEDLGAEKTLLIDEKTYVLWNELSEEEKGKLMDNHMILDIIQENGEFYINIEQLLEVVPETDIFDAPFITLEKSVNACTKSVCIQIFAGEELTLFGVHQHGDYFFQNVPYNGQLYRISCEELRSPSCLEAMAKKHSGRCCENQDLNGECSIIDYQYYTIEDRPSAQAEGDSTIWYKATQLATSCYIPFQDLLYGYSESEDKAWAEQLFGMEEGTCSVSLLQSKMIEKYARLNKGSAELEQMVREIWNTQTPDSFRFYMQIGLDTARDQAKILEKMIKKEAYNCSNFWFEFMGLYAGHITASLRHLKEDELPELDFMKQFKF